MSHQVRKVNPNIRRVSDSNGFHNGRKKSKNSHTPESASIETRRGFLDTLGKLALFGVLGGIAVDSIYENYEQNQQISNLTNEATLSDVMNVVKKIVPSTVMVEGESEVINFFTGQKQKVRGNGSGVILTTKSGEKYILTNAHVTKDHEIRANEFNDGVYHVTLYNGSDYNGNIQFESAPVILSNGKRALSPMEEHDLALLETPPNIKLPQNAGVSLRDLSKEPLQIGEFVIAIGSPRGLKDSVTFGMISHADRKIEGYSQNHHIQVDAPMNFGNSGGGLFDMQGRLIGLNCWKYNGDGLGASIRVDEILKMLSEWGIEL